MSGEPSCLWWKMLWNDVHPDNDRQKNMMIRKPRWYSRSDTVVLHLPTGLMAARVSDHATGLSIVR